MPFIHVKSLPFEPPLDVAAVVANLTRDFATDTGVGLEHVTATWEFLPAGHYAVGGRTAEHQPRTTHPVLVDLLTPDFNAPEKVETMLRSVAVSIARHTDLPLANIFVHRRAAQSGMVFDEGELVRW